MLKRIVLMIAVATWIMLPATARAQEHGAHGAAVAKETANDVPHEAAGVESHDAHGAHAKPPLIPDFTQRETQLQALWVVIIFIIMLMILYPMAWKPILIGLKKREAKIRQDIADAEEARKRAEKTLAEYNAQLAAAEGKVRDMIAKAASDAERIAATIRAQAQQESEQIKERTARDLEAAKNQAIGEIYAEAATLATTVAEKILRRNLNANDQRDLVAQSLEQLSSAGKR